MKRQVAFTFALVATWCLLIFWQLGSPANDWRAVAGDRLAPALALVSLGKLMFSARKRVDWEIFLSLSLLAFLYFGSVARF
jgi:hypothetical protein